MRLCSNGAGLFLCADKTFGTDAVLCINHRCRKTDPRRRVLWHHSGDLFFLHHINLKFQSLLFRLWTTWLNIYLPIDRYSRKFNQVTVSFTGCGTTCTSSNPSKALAFYFLSDSIPVYCWKDQVQKIPYFSWVSPPWLSVSDSQTLRCFNDGEMLRCQLICRAARVLLLEALLWLICYLMMPLMMRLPQAVRYLQVKWHHQLCQDWKLK